MHRPSIHHVTWGILALVLGCNQTLDPQADDDTDAPPLTSEGLLEQLDAPGAHQAGYRTSSVGYIPAGAEDERTLRLAWWYPTDATNGPYPTYQGQEQPGIFLDVPPADGPFPVMVFSHGHQGLAENMGRAMAHLATHGWVVVAPDHPGNTLFDGGDRDATGYLHRPLDVSAVIDHLEALPAEHPLAGRVDTEVIAASGHSFGGYTLMPLLGARFAAEPWEACAGDEPPPRCDAYDEGLAAIVADGAADPRIGAGVFVAAGNVDLFGAEGLGHIDRPVLQLTGDLDGSVRNEDNGDPLWAALPGPDQFRANLAHGDHQSFTDFAGVSLPGTSPDSLEPERAARITRVYLTAFVEYALRDNALAEAILTGEVQVDDDVTVSHKP